MASCGSVCRCRSDIILGAVGAQNNKVTQRNNWEHADTKITLGDEWQTVEGETRNCETKVGAKKETCIGVYTFDGFSQK